MDSMIPVGHLQLGMFYAKSLMHVVKTDTRRCLFTFELSVYFVFLIKCAFSFLLVVSFTKRFLLLCSFGMLLCFSYRICKNFENSQNNLGYIFCFQCYECEIYLKFSV